MRWAQTHDGICQIPRSITCVLSYRYLSQCTKSGDRFLTLQAPDLVTAKVEIGQRQVFNIDECVDRIPRPAPEDWLVHLTCKRGGDFCHSGDFYLVYDLQGEGHTGFSRNGQNITKHFTANDEARGSLWEKVRSRVTS